MVDYKYFDLFYKNNTNKQAKIEYSGGVMSNVELFQNSEELTESLCSEKELRFGCCEASSFKFKVANIVKPLIGETVTFSIVVDHHEDEPFLIGKYKVASDKETADRRYREVMAYDAMYDILNADVAAWYNSVLPNEDSTVTLKQFRESFVRHFGLTEVLPKGGLVNDDMVVQRTIQPEQISGKDVITAICEIHGCFGHIGRDGKFHYIYLPQAIEGLYPANDLYPDRAPEWMAQAKTGHLYPQDPKTTRIGKGSYIPPCNYESYRTKPITKLQIQMEENDIGKIWPETSLSDKDNCYIIRDNFLIYGKSSDELSVIAQNILGKITDIIYRPFDCTAVGNPCMEVGDPVRLNTEYEIVESYILTRTMKGIQALRDTYKSNGVEKYAEDINSVHRSIIQLKGKSNILTRTLEETKLEMYDIEQGLYNTITVTARDIRAELKNTADGLTNSINITAGQIRAELTDTKNELSNTISVTAGQIRTELKNTKDGLESTISQTASEIRAEVAQADAGLSSRITQNSNSITAEVTRATTAEGNLSASIKVNADNINLKVSRANLVSEINQSAEAVTIKAQKIDLQGLVNAQELTAKFATINTLNATTANLNNLIAEKATIESLNAAVARIGSIEADYATVGELNAESANLQNLIAQKIDATTVKADYMEVANWTSAGQIKASRIDVEDLLSANRIGSLVIHVNTLEASMRVSASLVNGDRVNCDNLNGHSVSWGTITVGTRSYTVLMG